MNNFIFRGPLPPSSPLFHGRRAELKFLRQTCLDDAQYYVILYGGRQSGKTSLLLKLSCQLPEYVHPIFVDFQRLPGSNISQVCRYLSDCLARSLSIIKKEEVDETSKLIDFIVEIQRNYPRERFVFLFEELYALPKQTREEFANVVRYMFTNRSILKLERLTVILTGSIELFQLASSDVSTLHNVCEPIYLGDLDEVEVMETIKYGLREQVYEEKLIIEIGRQIYEQVNGYPYLTQKIGKYLEEANDPIEGSICRLIEDAVNQILSGDDLLRHLKNGINEYNLWHAAKDLYYRTPPFSRLDEEMAQLELLGITKGQYGKWIVRNALFSKAINQWLEKKEEAETIKFKKAEKPHYIANFFDTEIQISSKDIINYRSNPNEFIDRLDKLSEMVNNNMSDLKRGQAAIYHQITGINQKKLNDVIEILKQGVVTQREMKNMLDAIRKVLLFLIENEEQGKFINNKVVHDSKAIIDSQIGIDQKIELTIPIIPLFLEYKLEVSNANEIEYKTLFREIINIWKSLTHP